MTAADHAKDWANTVRKAHAQAMEALGADVHGYSGPAIRDWEKELDAALDALAAQAETGDNLLSQCGMALEKAEAERDAAVQAAERLSQELDTESTAAQANWTRARVAEQAAEQWEEKAHGWRLIAEDADGVLFVKRAEAAEQAVEQAHAALDAIEAEPEDPLKVQAIARAALAGNQPPPPPRPKIDKPPATEPHGGF